MTKTKKNPVGRPKLKPEKALIDRVILRITAAERENYESKAKRKSLTLSAWIRQTLNLSKE